MRYKRDQFSTFRENDEGETELMANFVATIVEETRYVNGLTTETKLHIEGEQNGENPEADPIKLPRVEVTSESFQSMNWVLSNWGVRCVIRPGQGIKDDLRAEIQLASKPLVKTIYRHMGWTELAGGKRAYLHAGGAITAAGNDDSVTVQLPQELMLYDMATQVKPQDGARAILDLAGLAEPRIMWPMIAAALTPLYGPVDFAIHLAGRTGTFKSEVMSLMQSFYGPKMDARHLPGSWSSTGNALEAQAFYAANAAFVVDDFIPVGTSWQLRAYQQNADKLIRAQGNQSGRARLTDVSNLQRTMYPRGIILSTGEDTPEGHSIRARMLIIELSPGDVKPQALTRAQSMRPLFVGGTAALAQSLAKSPANLTQRMEELRRENIKIGHSRTPSMLGRLIATIEHFALWSKEIGAISNAESIVKEATTAILETGNKQNIYLEDSDPVDIFLGALRSTMSNGGGHVRTLTGGIPDKAASLGWNVDSDNSDMPIYKCKGPTIGWINWRTNELFLEINTGFAAVKKTAGSEFNLTKQTLVKRMKDAGILQRTDDARQRNTVRITAENHPRQVIAMTATDALNTQEAGDGDDIYESEGGSSDEDQ